MSAADNDIRAPILDLLSRLTVHATQALPSTSEDMSDSDVKLVLEAILGDIDELHGAAAGVLNNLNLMDVRCLPLPWAGAHRDLPVDLTDSQPEPDLSRAVRRNFSAVESGRGQYADSVTAPDAAAASAAAASNLCDQVKNALSTVLVHVARKGVGVDWSGPTRVLAMRCVSNALQCLREHFGPLSLVHDGEREVLEHMLAPVLSTIHEVATRPALFNAALEAMKQVCVSVKDDAAPELPLFQDLVRVVKAAQSKALSFQARKESSPMPRATHGLVAVFTTGAHASAALCELAHLSPNARLGLLAGELSDWMNDTVVLVQRLADRVRGGTLSVPDASKCQSLIVKLIDSLALVFDPKEAEVAAALSTALDAGVINTLAVAAQLELSSRGVDDTVAPSLCTAAQDILHLQLTISALKCLNQICGAAAARSHAVAHEVHAAGFVPVLLAALSAARSLWTGPQACAAGSANAQQATKSNSKDKDEVVDAVARSNCSALDVAQQLTQAVLDLLPIMRGACSAHVGEEGASSAPAANVLPTHPEAASAAVASADADASVAAAARPAEAALDASSWVPDHNAGTIEALLHVLATRSNLASDSESALALTVLQLCCFALSPGASFLGTTARTLARACGESYGAVQRCLAPDAPLRVRAAAAVLLSLLCADADGEEVATMLRRCGAELVPHMSQLLQDLQPVGDAVSTRVCSAVLWCLARVSPMNGDACPPASAGACLNVAVTTLVRLLRQPEIGSELQADFATAQSPTPPTEVVQAHIHDVLADKLLELDDDDTRMQRAASVVTCLARTHWLLRAPKEALAAALCPLLKSMAACMRQPHAIMSLSMTAAACAADEGRADMRLHALLTAAEAEVRERAHDLLMALCSSLVRFSDVRVPVLDMLLRVPWRTLPAASVAAALRALIAGQCSPTLVACAKSESYELRSRASKLLLETLGAGHAASADAGAGIESEVAASMFVALGSSLVENACGAVGDVGTRSYGAAGNVGATPCDESEGEVQQLITGAAKGADGPVTGSQHTAAAERWQADDQNRQQPHQAAAALASQLADAGLVPLLLLRISSDDTELHTRIASLKTLQSMLHLWPAIHQHVGPDMTASVAKLVASCVHTLRAEHRVRSRACNPSELPSELVEDACMAIRSLQLCIRGDAAAQQSAVDAGLLPCFAGMWHAPHRMLQCSPALHAELLRLLGALCTGNAEIQERFVRAGAFHTLMGGIAAGLLPPPVGTLGVCSSMHNEMAEHACKALALASDASPLSTRALLDASLGSLVERAVDVCCDMPKRARSAVLSLVVSAVCSGGKATSMVLGAGIVTMAAACVRVAAADRACATELPWRESLLLLLQVLLGRAASDSERTAVLSVQLAELPFASDAEVRAAFASAPAREAAGRAPAAAAWSDAAADTSSQLELYDDVLDAAGVLYELLEAALALDFNGEPVARTAATMLCIFAGSRALESSKLINLNAALQLANAEDSDATIWSLADGRSQLMLQLAANAAACTINLFAAAKQTLFTWLVKHATSAVRSNEPGAALLLRCMRALGANSADGVAVILQLPWKELCECHTSALTEPDSDARVGATELACACLRVLATTVQGVAAGAATALLNTMAELGAHVVTTDELVVLWNTAQQFLRRAQSSGGSSGESDGAGACAVLMELLLPNGSVAPAGAAVDCRSRFACSVLLAASTSIMASTPMSAALQHCRPRLLEMHGSDALAALLLVVDAVIGAAPAQFTVGQQLSSTDSAAAAAWYRRAADQDYAQALFELSVCLERGHGVPTDATAALPLCQRAAEQGLAAAQHRLGKLFEQGQGVPADTAQAAAWFKRAAEQGNAAAQYDLALCYEHGKGVGANAARAVEWYRRAADQGHAGAQYRLALCLQQGTGIAADAVQASELLQRAAAQGHIDAQYRFAVCLELGTGVKANAVHAVALFRRGAEQQHADSQVRLGMCFERGVGVEADASQALAWYQRAANQAHAEAAYRLGCMFEQGRGVPAKADEARTWYCRAVDWGHAAAQYWMGCCHEHGRNGFFMCATSALRLYKLAAEQGHAEARERMSADALHAAGMSMLSANSSQAMAYLEEAAALDHAESLFQLGQYYELACDFPAALGYHQRAAVLGHCESMELFGDGSQAGADAAFQAGEHWNGRGDSARAFRWFQHAAAQGHARAQFEVGLCYQYGRGTPASTSAAVHWFQRAHFRDADACYALAQFYEWGRGVQASSASALQYYQQAQSLGHPRAADDVRRLLPAPPRYSDDFGYSSYSSYPSYRRY